jgi:hypothetical protein
MDFMWGIMIIITLNLTVIFNISIFPKQM